MPSLVLSVCAIVLPRARRCLVESDSKQLLFPMPVVLMSVVLSSQERAQKSAASPDVTFDCPVYKYRERTDRHLVLSVSLPIRNKSARHWVLRGVALLCSGEF